MPRDSSSYTDARDARVLVTSSLNTPDGLAYDWVHHNLYWTDTGLDSISVINTDTLHRVELVKDFPDEPRAIVVDPRYKHG